MAADDQTPKYPQVVWLFPRFKADFLGFGVCCKGRAVQADVKVWKVRREEE